jgi:hypothetical protein
MPDSGRFPDRDIERGLRDLGARIEYPPTPDLAHAVRHRIEEEDVGQHTPRNRYWPSFLSPRWTAVAAAVVVVFAAALSPTLRTTLSDLFVSEDGANSGQQAGSGGSAVRPESGGSGARSGQEAGGPAGRPESGGREDTGSSAASRAQPMSGEESSQSDTAESGIDAGGVATCPSLSLEARPARAAPETAFRLHGEGFSTVCGEARPAHDVRIDFRQDGRIWKLATVGADRHLTFDTRLRVPAGARSGQATVRATTRSGELVDEHFVVLR